MNMQRTLTRMLGVLGASALLLSATVIPAEASKTSAASDCPAGWFCIFDNTNFTGRMLKFQNGGDLADWDFRDRAESWVNKTRYSVRLTNEHWYGDEHLTVAAGARNSDMGSWRNKVDRVRVNN
ncbi:MAG TPA: peptidase inhibitor family I36 protein [Herpetosiphonaceae bacterium]